MVAGRPGAVAPEPSVGDIPLNSPNCRANLAWSTMSRVVHIRRIEPGDGDLLRRIRLAALLDAPFAFASLHADEANRTHAKWSELAEARATGFDQATFLALVAGEVVGIVGGLRPDSNPTVELVSMWTAPGARRMGVGADLVRALLSWAQAGGARSVELWVTADNAPAVSLYQSLGIVPTGDSAPLRPGSYEHVQRMSCAIT
jgi:ribosomal protein S18 acetylase RimI-like enzyme